MIPYGSSSRLKARKWQHRVFVESSRDDGGSPTYPRCRLAMLSDPRSTEWFHRRFNPCGSYTLATLCCQSLALNTTGGAWNCWGDTDCDEATVTLVGDSYLMGYCGFAIFGKNCAVLFMGIGGEFVDAVEGFTAKAMSH